MGEFQRKVILVTGGSSGIGKAAAALFCKHGAVVYIVGRDRDKLEQAARKIRTGFQYAGEDAGKSQMSGSSNVYTVSADVSVVEDCRRSVEKVVHDQGRLDAVVNSAGIWLEGDSDKVGEEEWDRVIDINLKGTFFIIRYAIPELEKTAGCIVNVSSDSGLVGNDRAAVYCASKGGVTLLTKALAVELGRRGIRVNAVCPGEVDTPMLEAAFKTYSTGDWETYKTGLLAAYPDSKNKRFTTPEEVAEVILFLCSKKVEAMTGACVSIDFGLTAGY